MKKTTLLLTVLAACSATSARADRVLWTETATVRTKTIFADDGTLLYQQNWDKATRQPVGTAVDRRKEHGAWEAAKARGPAHYGTPPGPAHPMPPHGTAAGAPFLPPAQAAQPFQPAHHYGTPPSYGATPKSAWIPGPFVAPPAAYAPAAPGHHAAPPLDPRAAVQAVGPGLHEAEGHMNPHPEWTRLYDAANAPMPERDAHGLPPPPVDQPTQAPLQARPGHPDAPGQTDMRWYNRVGGKVLMRPDSMIRVKVLDKMSSKRNKRGDTFRFVILEPVMYGLRTLVPAGTKGIGRVGRARSRSHFGKPGMLQLEFGSVDLPGATPARIYLAETVIHPTPRETTAAGASAVGLLAFGPLGLVAGAAIQGQDVNVAAGTVFHVEVAVDVPYMHTATGY